MDFMQPTQKLPRPSSPIYSSNCTSFKQPSFTSKPTTSFYSNNVQSHRPHSQMSRKVDYNLPKYSKDDDLWKQPQEYVDYSYHGGKGTPPNGRLYPAYTTCRENKISQFPGPGSYNATLKSGGPSFSMGSRSSLRKMAKERSYSPGPGTYNVSNKHSGPSFSIAPKVRQLVSQKDLNPGPGTYSDLSNSFGRGLSFSIRERLK